MPQSSNPLIMAFKLMILMNTLKNDLEDKPTILQMLSNLDPDTLARMRENADFIKQQLKDLKSE